MRNEIKVENNTTLAIWKVREILISVLCHADDIVVFGDPEKQLQKDISIFNKEIKKKNRKINNKNEDYDNKRHIK